MGRLRGQCSDHVPGRLHPVHRPRLSDRLWYPAYRSSRICVPTNESSVRCDQKSCTNKRLLRRRTSDIILLVLNPAPCSALSKKTIADLSDGLISIRMRDAPDFRDEFGNRKSPRGDHPSRGILVSPTTAPPIRLTFSKCQTQ